jgi:dipeptidase E
LTRASPQILAFGGGALEPEAEPLRRLMHGLTGKERPRIVNVPTASAENRDALVRFYALHSPHAEVSHADFFPWPRPDLREHVLSRDVVFVGGGNTANMLAVWRAHGFDAILREAWERGIVLAGVSAGMICWFEAGVTDSFGPQLEGMRDGLGFLPGSACPHYDGEERRRPVYTGLVAGGFPPGYAAEDGVALHFAGTELREAVTWRAGGRAYRVEAAGETPIDARLLP